MTTPEHELLIETRRDLHRHPEIGYEEHRTAGIVADRLRRAGYEVVTGIAGTGVVGTLRGAGGDGPTLLLRADMDALPIQEANSHDFVSTVPGRMHACGHDAHVAIGLAVAERLAGRRDELPGEVRYVFQPAEESLGGARKMVEAGVLEGVDGAMGLHVWLGLPVGIIGVVEGAQMAGCQEFRIRVIGRGGHGGLPHEAVDAIYLASQVVVALQGIVSRNVSPLDAAVVTIGEFRAGDTPNIIAETATLAGTIRTFRTELTEDVRRRIRETAEHVAEALGGTAIVDFHELAFGPTVNDPGMARIVRDAAIDVVGESRVRSDAGVITMAAEDFSEFADRVPACYFFLGAHEPGTGAVHPHHSPHFDLCEDALPIGVEILERAALAFLTARD